MSKLLSDLEQENQIEEETEEKIEEEIKQLEENSEELDDVLSAYIKEASKYRLLTEEEKISLISEYQKTHDINIRNKLVQHNLRLSIYIAKRYQYVCQSMELTDLIQECNFTLIDSVDKFDISKKIKFSTYVVKAMERNIKRDIDQKDRIIKKPINVEIINFKYKKYIEQYYEKYKCYPTDEEIKQELQITDYQLNQQKCIDYFNADSLNKRIENKDGSGSELEEFVKDKNDDYSSYNNFLDTQILLISARKILKPREYYMIYEKYISDKRKTLAEIGQEFGITRERARQIEKKALEQMNKVLKKYQKQTLEEYSIQEIENMNTRALSPGEISVYHNLKHGIDKIDYFFLYTIRENGYNMKKIDNIFSFLSDKELNEKKEICNSYIEFFKEKNRKDCLNRLLNDYSVDEIFYLDIKPEVTLDEVKKKYIKPEKNKELLKNKK